MSSGGTVMFPTARSSAGGDGGGDVECRACYGVVAACVSLLLFCVLAATAGVIKACAVTCFAAVFFGVIGWLVPAGASTRGSYAAGASALRLVGAVATDVPPAFAYECPTEAEDAGGKPGGSCALCAVCLEHVRRGETVRRLPACGHLFHKECIDMWLNSHATCPLCRRDLLPPRTCAAKNVSSPAAAQSSGDVLPPV